MSKFKKVFATFVAIAAFINLSHPQAIAVPSNQASFSQTTSPSAGDTVAFITTSKGVIKAKIFTNIVPDAARNFTELARQGKYKGTIFHRVIPNFVIQGGDFTKKDGTGGYSARGPGTTIADQYDSRLTHLRGALAWAKTSAPESIGSQFYIVHNSQGTHSLDHPASGGPSDGYTVFGQVYEGFDVVDSIARTDTDGRDRPLKDVIIENVEIKELK